MKLYIFNKSPLFLFVVLYAFCGSSYAVDGYKSMKFGMTKQEITDSQVCSFKKMESGLVGVNSLECSDFTFGGKIVEAGAFFIGGKFLRFIIIPNSDIISGLMSGLFEKYGVPSSQSSNAEFKAVGKFPNKRAFVAFDANTVELRVMSDENHVQSIFLIYTSKKFDILSSKLQQSSVTNDL